MDNSKQNEITDQTMHTFSGTKGFFAPELMVPNPVFKKSVDIYALGVILYLLLET